MELGMIGLGRMGFNMAERLIKGGHRVVGYARDKETVKRAMEKGVEGAFSIEELINKLASPRIIWLMVPAGETVDQLIDLLLTCLSQGDIIVDGGNSYYKDSIRRFKALKGKGIHFLDAGVSGGIWGLKEGYCLMLGGEQEIVERLAPVFKTLAPAPDKGWGQVGPNGAGHFVKMTHNGIEYGMMEAIAEGFALMKKKVDFNLDLHKIAELWRYGSVVRSWLLDLTADALAERQDLSDVAPYVADSGEGRWTVFEAIDLDVTAPVITLSLFQRFRSRDKDAFADRLLALMRQQFGGHELKKEN